MRYISVRAKPGRVVFSPTDGYPIPSDRYVTVERTKAIWRAVEVWGDLEVEPQPVKAKAAPNIPTKVEPVTEGPIKEKAAS